jgi:hypothetical protein
LGEHAARQVSTLILIALFASYIGYVLRRWPIASSVVAGNNRGVRLRGGPALGTGADLRRGSVVRVLPPLARSLRSTTFATRERAR